MRILMVNSHLIPRGGDWAYISTLSHTLREHGHEVLLYGLAVDGAQSTIPRNELLPEVDFKADFIRPSLRGAVRVVSRTVYSFEAKRSMLKVLKKYRPDVVHLNNIHHFLTPSVVWAMVAERTPVVWTLHDYTIVCPDTTMRSKGRVCQSCLPGRFYHCVAQRCKRGSVLASGLAAAEAYCHHMMKVYDRVFRYIAPSAFLRNKFLEAGFSENRIVHIANPLPYGSPLSEHRATGSGLFIGRLSEEKGLWTLMQALVELPDTGFDIVGDGPLRPDLEKLCQERSLRHVRFHGKLNPVVAAEITGKCRFVVVPSEWFENCPYAVLEAMQAGKPVIASAIGGLPELIRDGVNGILCPPGDVDAFREAIGRLDADDQLCAKQGREAARIVHEEYNSDLHYQRLSEIYSAAVHHS
jgi:glycosyltransferase involved in cell wall biosynthesis